ncbi:MAG TPA: glycosyltransferase [Polyangiaceae bacterium]|nr:glycosyltransferase [Polyangiaceae bacterium]
MHRIAFVADTLYSSSGGGILSGQYVVDRLRRDHEVVTVASDGDAPLRAFQLPVRAMRETRFVMAEPDREVLRDAFARSEVVHLQFPFWLSFAALDVARQLGLPVVAGFHVQPENALLSVGIHARWLNNAVYKLLVKQFYGKVDAVVCPTPFAEEKLRSHGLRTPTFVISNGVPPDAVASTALLEPRPADPQAPFFILAVGRLAAEKRQDVIIEAVRLSKHRDRIRLVLAGGGPRQEDLERRASALPNGAEIGFLPRETLLRYFAEADLFVHASEVELEGMAVLEAMNAGLPALVAQAPESAASAFAMSDDFRFPAGDARTLSARIDALVEDRAKLQAAREPYRRHARLFDFDASVDRLVRVYEAVLEQRHGSLARIA